MLLASFSTSLGPCTSLLSIFSTREGLLIFFGVYSLYPNWILDHRCLRGSLPVRLGAGQCCALWPTFWALKTANAKFTKSEEWPCRIFVIFSTGLCLTGVSCSWVGPPQALGEQETFALCLTRFYRIAAFARTAGHCFAVFFSYLLFIFGYQIQGVSHASSEREEKEMIEVWKRLRFHLVIFIWTLTDSLSVSSIGGPSRPSRPSLLDLT